MTQASTLTRRILFRLPAELVATPIDSLSHKNLQMTPSPAAVTKPLAVSLFNSVILVTALSVVLVLVGLGCFVVSATFYLQSCRAAAGGKGAQATGVPFHSSQLIETDLTSNSESGIASGGQSRSTSSSSTSSIMQQSLSESIGELKGSMLDFTVNL